MQPLNAYTTKLIGEQRRASVRVARSTTYGLGGVSIEVRGTGAVSIDKQAFGPHERAQRHSLTLPPGDVDAIFEAFIAEDFGQLVIPQHFGVPDEISYTVELTSDTGEKRALHKFVLTKLDRFDRLVAVVGATVAKHLTKQQREQLTL